MNEITIGLLIGVVSSTFAAGLIAVIHSSKARLRRRFRKFTYFRVIRLRFSERGDAPYYERKHHTIASHTDPVYDEVLVLSSAQCNVPAQLEPVRITSVGTVDALQVLPNLSEDADSRPQTKIQTGDFKFSHPEPTDHLVAVGTNINGLQSPYHWNFSTSAEHNNQDLVLVADFGSLPYKSEAVRNVKFRAFNRGIELDIQKFITKGEWYTNSLGNSIFYLQLKRAKKETLIQIDFDINRDAIPNLQAEEPMERRSHRQ